MKFNRIIQISNDCLFRHKYNDIVISAGGKNTIQNISNYNFPKITVKFILLKKWADINLNELTNSMLNRLGAPKRSEDIDPDIVDRN